MFLIFFVCFVVVFFFLVSFCFVLFFISLFVFCRCCCCCCCCFVSFFCFLFYRRQEQFDPSPLHLTSSNLTPRVSLLPPPPPPRPPSPQKRAKGGTLCSRSWGREKERPWEQGWCVSYTAKGLNSVDIMERWEEDARGKSVACFPIFFQRLQTWVSPEDIFSSISH